MDAADLTGEIVEPPSMAQRNCVVSVNAQSSRSPSWVMDLWPLMLLLYGGDTLLPYGRISRK